MASLRPRAFIVSLESGATDADLLESLARLGLDVDREYGLVKLDLRGAQRVTRVIATEQQLERAQSSLAFTFYPDLTVFRSPP